MDILYNFWYCITKISSAHLSLPYPQFATSVLPLEYLNIVVLNMFLVKSS